MGCDKKTDSLKPLDVYFNPRTHVGCDQCKQLRPILRLISIHAPMWGATYYYSPAGQVNKFQSTHPCGVRPFFKLQGPNIPGFQSTHPCGVRLFDCYYVPLDVTISIHAPMWGATENENQDLTIEQISIHAPMWGATVPFDTVL